MKVTSSPNEQLFELQNSRSQLTSVEERDLERIESTIAAKLAAFFEVAHALMQIKQRKLYRAEFQTFEEYCRKRWDMHRAYAYRLIGAAEVCKNLSPMGDIPLPESERQIRPLVGLPCDIVAKAWKRAWTNAAGSKVTGGIVQRAVGEVTRKRKGNERTGSRSNWQISVEPLLKEAVSLTQKGDQEAVAEIIDRVSLLLLVGRRFPTGKCTNTPTR